MKDIEEFLKNFPEVNATIENTKNQIKGIDEQIKNLRHDQPKPHLKPAGAPPVRNHENYNIEKARLEAEKVKLKEQSYKEINSILTHVEEDKKEAINNYMRDQYDPDKHEERETKSSLANNLMSTLPSSKVEKLNEFKDNSATMTKSQIDNSKKLSNAERLMESLPSSKLKNEFKDNARDMTKDMDRHSYEPELD